MKVKTHKGKKYKLFKKLQKLDREIGLIDKHFGYLFLIGQISEYVKMAKLKREKLDMRRAKARIERKKYDKTTNS